uniref:Uncharacterized protein n=1 Tax=Nelumbo nucifera TaxID=4432 RepID=A0A822YQR5_NELNU|nr:TPA_asm: hypothetical protein HUJ06_012560 [Nelumbo nucifera]
MEESLRPTTRFKDSSREKASHSHSVAEQGFNRTAPTVMNYLHDL